MRFLLSMVMVIGIALPGTLLAQAEKSEKDCLDQLRKDCKGLGIGKYCGMKHGAH